MNNICLSFMILIHNHKIYSDAMCEKWLALSPFWRGTYIFMLLIIPIKQAETLTNLLHVAAFDHDVKIWFLPLIHFMAF